MNIQNRIVNCLCYVEDWLLSIRKDKRVKPTPFKLWVDNYLC